MHHNSLAMVICDSSIMDVPVGGCLKSESASFISLFLNIAG